MSPRELTLQPVALDDECAGRVQVDGRDWQVIGALINEQVQAQVIRKNKNMGMAVCQSVAEANPWRIKPHCQHFGVCSGCQLQHLGSEQQMLLKREKLQERCQTLGLKIPSIDVLQANPWHYRRHARLSVRWDKKKDCLHMGFREYQSRFVQHMESCAILPEAFNTILACFKQMLSSLSVREAIAQVELLQDDQGLHLTLRVLAAMTAEDERRLRQWQAQYERVFLWLQPSARERIPLHELNEHRIRVQGLDFHFSGDDFIQVNAAINEKMLTWLKKHCQGERLVDYFCGIGNLSLSLATSFKAVLGFECQMAMVARARENAKRNHLDHCQFVEQDLYVEPTWTHWPLRVSDQVILDPPRSGAEKLCQELTNQPVRQVIYVSCQASTFIRDALLLQKAGFHIRAIAIADMFSHTKHYEILSAFER